MQQQADLGRKDLEKARSDSPPTTADFVKQAKQSRVRIEEKQFALEKVWDKSLFELKPLRGEPELFPVTDLRGAGGLGGFRKALVPVATVRPAAGKATPDAKKSKTDKTDMTDAARRVIALAPGDEVVGKHWVVLTGLVPLEKQYAAYEEAYKNSVRYNRMSDIPVYLGYWVQRIEVTSPADAAKPQWDKAKEIMSKNASDAARFEWSAEGREVVARDFTDGRLTFPLGPLVGRAWGDSVAHPPEVPLATNAVLDSDEMRMQQEAEARAMQENLARSRAMESGRLGGDGREGMSSIQDDTIFGTGPESDIPLDEARLNREQIALPKNRLFRFFDFSVEPGKQYLYRVRLALYNPNRRLTTSILQGADLAKKDFLETKWSDPSPVIAVPLNASVLLTGVKAAEARRRRANRLDIVDAMGAGQGHRGVRGLSYAGCARQGSELRREVQAAASPRRPVSRSSRL